MDLFDVWKLHTAVLSGGKPEIEKDDIPLEIGQ
jgi:hypothetical protein